MMSLTMCLRVDDDNQTPAPKVDLTKWGLAEVSLSKMLSYWDLPTTQVDLTKWGLVKVSPTTMLTFSE